MDQERTRDAIDAFRSAEDAINRVISSAGELTESAESIRDTDQSVKALAEAVGIASKQWVEIATELKDVTAEVQAAAKLLQKAEPQELMEAVDETTTSVGELRATTKSVAESVDRSSTQLEHLTARVDAAAEASTSLREALVAKMDLQVSAIAKLDADLERSTASLTNWIDESNRALNQEIERKTTSLIDRIEESDRDRMRDNDSLVVWVKRTMYIAVSATVAAAASAILIVVL